MLEVASESTASRDLNEKRRIYARMGAQEYWRLDKCIEYYGEPLVGERLVNGEYERFDLHAADNGDIWAHSEALGVDFFYRREEVFGRFLMRDSVTGEWINLTESYEALWEAKEQLRTAETQVREAQVQVQAAETQVREAQVQIREAEEQVREAQVQAQQYRAQMRASAARNRELEAELERLRRQQS